MRYKERLNKLMTLLQLNGLQAMIIWDAYDLLYFTGVCGAGSLIVDVGGETRLYVPPINFETAERYAFPGLNIEKTRIDEPLEVVVAHSILGVNGVVGVDRMDVETYRRLVSMVPNIEIRPVMSMIWEIRSIKDMQEISIIREACRISDRAMKAASDVLSPGITENEVKSEIVSEIYRQLGEKPAFDIVVASADRSSLPHGPLQRGDVRDRVINSGDVVLIDLGVTIEGYCSDITRTFVIGKPKDSDFESVYHSVLNAKEAAQSFMRSGVSCSYVDGVARGILSEKELDKHFIHGLGHGVGLEIHEPPRLAPTSPDQLSEGNVVTCEPGVYFEGRWGIRIEDTLLITDKGFELLTSYPVDEYIIY
ncbi:MAG: Xaa-Pro peptidase family protein [Nitrososphaerota archaeon]